MIYKQVIENHLVTHYEDEKLASITQMLQGIKVDKRVPGLIGQVNPVNQEPKTRTKLKKETRETREAPTQPSTVLASPGQVQGAMARPAEYLLEQETSL